MKSDQILDGTESMKFPRRRDGDCRSGGIGPCLLAGESGGWYRRGSVCRFSSGKLRRSPCGRF